MLKLQNRHILRVSISRGFSILSAAILLESISAIEDCRWQERIYHIDREINVMPIVPPGNSLDEMILESEENRE